MYTLLAWFVAIGTPAWAGQVTVFAAASSADALDEVIESFNAKGEHTAVASYASSSTLAKQIENGAPAGVFLAANPAWMDYIAAKGLTKERADFVGNRLVVVVPAGADDALELSPDSDLVSGLDGRRIAIGDPDHVPGGQYAKAALESLDLWSTLVPHLARGADVRAALAYVERGEAPYGFVYATDAVASGKVTVAAVFPQGSYPPITYPVGRLTDDPAARAFYTHLLDDGFQVFARHGFSRP